MHLTHCTLTGVDESTDLAALVALSAEFPVVEWGFLFSPKHAGQPGRYPSVATLERALDELPPEVRVALHVCGKGVRDLLTAVAVGHEELRKLDPDEAAVASLVGQVAARNGRVQLNFDQRATPVDLGALGGLMEAFPDTVFITQHNSANAQVHESLLWVPNHAVLFDASGGRGTLPLAWSEPLPWTPCGHAGGLGPDNLEGELAEIAEVTGDRSTWVDMESRLRTVDDKFDLAQCRRSLEAVARWGARSIGQAVSNGSAA